jgi:hypothetical protein
MWPPLLSIDIAALAAAVASIAFSERQDTSVRLKIIKVKHLLVLTRMRSGDSPV